MVALVQPTTAPISVAVPTAAFDAGESPELPVTAAAVPEGSLEDDARPPRQLARRVLVVEDEPPIRAMLCELLEARGYGVIQAVDRLEDVQVLRGDRARLDRPRPFSPSGATRS